MIFYEFWKEHCGYWKMGNECHFRPFYFFSSIQIVVNFAVFSLTEEDKFNPQCIVPVLCTLLVLCK